MATVRPARTYCRQLTDFDLYWTVGGGAVVPTHTGEQLQIETNGDAAGGNAADIVRSAIKFNTTVPTWATVGNIAHITSLLLIWIAKAATEIELKLVIPVNPITTAMTCAQLDAEWAAGAVYGTTFVCDIVGWQVIDMRSLTAGQHANLLANGLLLCATYGVENTRYMLQLGRESQNIGTILQRHYQYTVRSAAAGGDDTRRTLSTAAQNQLDSLDPCRFVIEGSVLFSEIDSSYSDISITDELTADTKLNLIQSECNPRESWKINKLKHGSISIGTISSLENIIDSDYWNEVDGVPVEVSVKLKLNSGAKETINAIRSEVADIVQHQHLKELPIENPINREIKAEIQRLSPYEYLPVDGAATQLNWSGENPLTILWDCLMNILPSTHWADIFPADWMWLKKRFMPVWRHRATVTYAQTTADYSDVNDLILQMASTHGLFISIDVSGRMLVFNPAVYRPSMKVHTINLNDDAVSSYSLRTLRKNYYESIGITDGTIDEKRRFGTDISRIESGRNYQLDYVSGTFDANDEYVWLALMRHISQRFSQRVYELRMTVKKTALSWMIGDQLQVTNSRKDHDGNETMFGFSTKTFMAISSKSSPTSGAVDIRAIHFSGWDGGHSLFQENGPRGLYRWVSMTAAATMTNSTWNTVDQIGAYTIVGPDGLSQHIGIRQVWEGNGMGFNADPQGRNVFASPNTFYPDGSKYDLVDMVWVFKQFTSGIGTYVYFMIWRWYNPTTKEGVALLMHNAGGVGVSSESMRLILVHATDCTVINVAWAGVITNLVELPRGITTKGAAGYNIRSISVIWNPDNSVDLYEAQKFIGTLATSPTKSNSFNQSDLRPNAAAAIACLRWTQRVAVFDDNELLPNNGYDPYYK